MWALALGPGTAGFLGAGASLRPYTLLTYLPGFDGLRAPARFAMLAVLCLVVAASLAFRRLARRPADVAAGHFAVVVLAGLSIDGWMRAMPLVSARRAA